MRRLTSGTRFALSGPENRALDEQGHAIADPGRDLDLDDLLAEGQADEA